MTAKQQAMEDISAEESRMVLNFENAIIQSEIDDDIEDEMIDQGTQLWY